MLQKTNGKIRCSLSEQHKECFMKKAMSILCLGVLWMVIPSRAQLAPVNEVGLSWGHMHLYPPDRELEAKAWIRMGGQLLNNFSGNIPIGFPGVIILVGAQRKTSQGTAGSTVDHLAFRVPDLQADLTRWEGVKTWWLPLRNGPNQGLDGNWGFKFEKGDKPGQAFVTTPGGIKCEIIEDKSLKVPIVFDHTHFVVETSRMKDMEAFYTKAFGAKPVKGEPDTLMIPGGKLIFTGSPTPTANTVGRTLDHIGMNMLNADALSAFSKNLEAKGIKLQRPYESSSMGMSRLEDGFGTVIEITKAQGGYFDAKLLDSAFYQVDEGARKPGDPRPPQR
jgi:catechol 2,3-dioxygenase-like lactoylglutathione lyase family enzyme